MKGKLPPAQLADLTREYHRTYGSLGSIAGEKFCLQKFFMMLV